MDQIVEVVGVTRATEFFSGKAIYSIQFGNIKEMEVPVPTTIPPAIGIVATIFVDFEGSAPYKVGSKWIFSIDENGSFQMRPADVHQ